MTPARAAQPAASVTSRDGDEGSTPASPLPSSDMLDVGKRTAARLAIPWPAVVAETTRSGYEGKKLPLARSATKQLLPVFPELLVEVARSWRDRLHSSRSPIPWAWSWSLGLLRMPPMEPLVAAHVHLRLSAVSSRSPSLPSKSDRFQSALTEKAYKAVALSARALNVLSLLMAYQAELCEDFGQTQDPAMEEIPVVTDLCLRVQRCAVQATGRALGTMVLQERARWLNLANLSDREKDDVLDMPIVPEGIFGSALASMQRRCEAKKKEDEALRLCLPRPRGPPRTHLPATTDRTGVYQEERTFVMSTSTHTNHTSFNKTIKMCSAAASRPSAEGAANKSQTYPNKLRGGYARCPPSAESHGFPRGGGGCWPRRCVVLPGKNAQRCLGAMSLFHQGRAPPHHGWGLSRWRGCGVCPLSPPDGRGGPRSQPHRGC